MNTSWSKTFATATEASKQLAIFMPLACTVKAQTLKDTVYATSPQK